MKKLACYSSILLISISSLALAEQNKLVTIVNHFNKPLKFTVHINPDALPDFAKTFVVAEQSSVTSKMIDNQLESYIQTQDGNGNSGYFGVEIINDSVYFHGYVSKGIAYSWNAQSVVFCTPEEYKKTGSCL